MRSAVISQPGWVTVGTEVDIRHLAAALVGATVRTTAKVIAVERRVIRFEVEAFEGTRKLGEGRHARGLVNVESFNKRLGRSKSASDAARAAHHPSRKLLKMMDCFVSPQYERLLRQFLRALRRRRNRADHQRLQAVLAHQHFERRGGGAAGRGDVLAQASRTASSERCSNSPEPATVSRASLVASSSGRPAATPARASSSASRNT